MQCPDFFPNTSIDYGNGKRNIQKVISKITKLFIIVAKHTEDSKYIIQ